MTRRTANSAAMTRMAGSAAIEPWSRLAAPSACATAVAGSKASTRAANWAALRETSFPDPDWEPAIVMRHCPDGPAQRFAAPRIPGGWATDCCGHCSPPPALEFPATAATCLTLSRSAAYRCQSADGSTGVGSLSVVTKPMFRLTCRLHRLVTGRAPEFPACASASHSTPRIPTHGETCPRGSDAYSKVRQRGLVACLAPVSILQPKSLARATSDPGHEVEWMLD